MREVIGGLFGGTVARTLESAFILPKIAGYKVRATVAAAPLKISIPKPVICLKKAFGTRDCLLARGRTEQLR